MKPQFKMPDPLAPDASKSARKKHRLKTESYYDQVNKYGELQCQKFSESLTGRGPKKQVSLPKKKEPPKPGDRPEWPTLAEGNTAQDRKENKNKKQEFREDLKDWSALKRAWDIYILPSKPLRKPDYPGEGSVGSGPSAKALERHKIDLWKWSRKMRERGHEAPEVKCPF